MRKPSQISGRRSQSTGESASFSATDAQRHFGRLLDRTSSDGVVYITRYERPCAVLLSVGRYEALTRTQSPDLDAVTREIDEMMERMQSPQAAAGYDALFSASPETLALARASSVRTP